MPLPRLFKSLSCALVMVLLLGACVTDLGPSKPYRGPGWYTVKTSDTLYSIAWRYGLDYKELARWNGIDVNAPIHPGQRLRLIQVSTPPVATSSSQPTRPASPSPEKPEKAAPTAQVDSGNDPQQWLWPTDGKLLSTFLASKLDRRGIVIGGQAGQPVRAVADGRVVYSGNGLAGYGNLIIIKHSETYLSAYAYCQERLVQEGNRVKAGKVVARMGSKDNTVKLHFEIRRNGKPVDPLKFLPKR